MNLLCGEDCSSSVDGREGEVVTPLTPLESMPTLMMMADDTVIEMMEKERFFSPKEDYLSKLNSGSLNVSARNDSVEWIFKVVSLYKFGPSTACLAVNYLDRFLSEDAFPEGKPWMVHLLSVACLSVAAKMEETDVPLPLDLQMAESKFVFESRTIERMEILLLNRLKWKMNGVTPLSFIDFFLGRIIHADHLLESVVSKSVDLILNVIKGIEFLEFRPSEIALGVAVYAACETEALHFMDVLDSCSFQTDKEKALKCYELIQEMMLVKQWWNVKTVDSGSSSPGSPAGVLEAAACLSHGSSRKEVPSSCGESNNSVETTEMSNIPSKRRKISG